jgi:hypothetical protein
MQKQKLLPGEKKYFLPNSETDLMKHYFSVCRRWQDTYRNIGKTNMNMTNILRNNVSQFVPGSEAAEAFRKWRGIGQKGHFCILPKSNDFMSFTSRTKIFENMESQSITSEMAFTESLLLQKGNFLSCKRGRSFKKYFFRSVNGAL